MNGEKLLAPKEMADKLGRDVSYVFAMKRRGFQMPGNRGYLSEARNFLLKCPKPRKICPLREK